NECRGRDLVAAQRASSRHQPSRHQCFSEHRLRNRGELPAQARVQREPLLPPFVWYSSVVDERKGSVFVHQTVGIQTTSEDAPYEKTTPSRIRDRTEDRCRRARRCSQNRRRSCPNGIFET